MISETEYNSYYASYINLAQQKPLLPALISGLKETKAFFQSIPESKHEYRYDTDKWTPKEILLHLIDTERVFMYRALQFARAENVELEGYDQDEFAANSKANSREMSSLIAEYEAVRMGTLAFIGSCDAENLERAGTANESPLSVRAAAYIICGHEIHHSNVITERYL